MPLELGILQQLIKNWEIFMCYCKKKFEELTHLLGVRIKFIAKTKSDHSEFQSYIFVRMRIYGQVLMQLILWENWVELWKKGSVLELGMGPKFGPTWGSGKSLTLFYFSELTFGNFKLTNEIFMNTHLFQWYFDIS